MNNHNQRAGFLPIGKVVGLHGIKGDVKINSYAESLDIFKPETRLFLKAPGKEQTGYTVRWAKPHSKGARLSLKEIETRNQAEDLVGATIFIEKTSLPEPEAGSYYWFDIIGLSVYTVDGVFLGWVDSILQTGSNDVYVVKNRDKGPASETLVPALESVIRTIDLNEKIMRVDLPDGL